MAERTRPLSHVATLTPAEAADVLEELAAGIRRGKLRLGLEGAEVRLRPTRSVRTELRLRGASAALGGRVDLDLGWTRLETEPDED